jgi:ABC-2 type transport system permease protein
MTWRAIATLAGKELTLFSRNRFFTLVSVLGLVAYVAIFYAMPGSVDEVLEIALYAPVLPRVFNAAQRADGLAIEIMESEDSLREAVADGRYPAGVVLPPDFEQSLLAGEPVRVSAFLASSIPAELESAMTAVIDRFAFLQSGQMLPVEVSREVLGPDMVGQQIAPRDRMVPLLAVLIILTETLGLASLISEEVVGQTVQALLITPMTVGGFFLAKGVTGVGLAFGQVTIFLALAGGLSQQPVLMLVTLLLGAVLVTGIGFLLGSVGKDLTSVMAWGVPVLIILLIPAFTLVFPGAVSDWIKIIPSYYLVDTAFRAANLGADWGDLWSNLVVLLALDILFVGLGVSALRRKVR